MEEFRCRLEEINRLLPSSSVAEKSIGYKALSLLQERFGDDPSAIDALRDWLPRFLPWVRRDIAVEDEEAASQALKCLGFTIYHPILVAAISDGDVQSIIDSLVNLIRSTRIKAICNLGVWCISIQQFNTSLVTARLHLLVKAVIYALDNPMGSMSTSFEAIQALMKLASQTSDKMRTVSDTWVPPICRRLFSLDKRERDMAIRCLQKTKLSTLPSPPTLSKAVLAYVRPTLVSQLDELLTHPGGKVHCLQAWGWLVQLLGFYMVKDRQLLNQMLKIPEKTFSDTDPQVQIASQVAWQGLIDVFLHFLPRSVEEHRHQLSIRLATHPLPHDANQPTDVLENCASPEGSTSDDRSQVSRFWKRIKLLMKPLFRLMSSRCNVTVRLSCLKTWFYLLHKLGFLVNHQLVTLLVLEPIFSTVFQRGLEKNNICVWRSCIDLFHDFILSTGMVDQSNDRGIGHSNDLVHGCELNKNNRFSCTNSCQEYSVKWMPSGHKKLEFTIKIMQCIVTGVTENNPSPENVKMLSDAVMRLFPSVVLEVLNSETNPLSQSFGSCLNILLKFIYDWCRDVKLKFNDTCYQEVHYVTLQLLETVLSELPNAVLVSPLTDFFLDIKEIIGLQSTDAIQDVKVKLAGISLMICMDSISAMSFVTLLYLHVMASFMSNTSHESLFHEMEKFSKLAFSVFYPMHFSALVEILYLSIYSPIIDGQYWLKVWIMFVKTLRELFDRVENALSCMAREANSCSVVYYFLCFPLQVCCSSLSLFTTVGDGGSPSPSAVFDLKNQELELVIKIWRSVNDSMKRSSKNSIEICLFTEGLSQKLIDTVNRSSAEDLVFQSSILSFLFGEIATYLLNMGPILEVVGSNQTNRCIRDTLRLVARFLQLSLVFIKADKKIHHLAISSVFAGIAGLLIHLKLKEDILLLVETLSETLTEWLSSFGNLLSDSQYQSLVSQFVSMWIHLLDCMERSQPSFVNDFSFLNSQAHIIELALSHPHAPIADATINFWMKTYGKSALVSYPKCLHPVLSKLSFSGNLCLQTAQDGSEVAKNIHGDRWLGVKAIQKQSSKRVSFIKENNIKFTKLPSVVGLKRKNMEEPRDHQREVKRLQQGRDKYRTGYGRV